MDALKPLRTGLFFYEVLRFLLLVFFLYIVPLEGGFSGSLENRLLIPYSVYLSSNVLFPLMALFVWLKPQEYRSYLNLYMAGKIISGFSFYVWEFFSFSRGTGGFSVRIPPGLGGDSGVSPGMGKVILLLLMGGSILINLADILSVWGAWTLKNKFRRMEKDVLADG